MKPVWGFGWGYEQGSVGQWRIGKGTMGIMAGCISALALMIALVLSKGKNGGNDLNTWAWIDVVSFDINLWTPSREYHQAAVRSSNVHFRFGLSKDKILSPFSDCFRRFNSSRFMLWDTSS